MEVVKLQTNVRLHKSQDRAHSIILRTSELCKGSATVVLRFMWSNLAEQICDVFHKRSKLTLFRVKCNEIQKLVDIHNV